MSSISVSIPILGGCCCNVGQSDVNQVYRLLGLGVSVVESSEGELTPLLNRVVRQGNPSVSL